MQPFPYGGRCYDVSRRMTSSTSTSTDDEPVLIELEFVRAKEADDAFAFRFSRQTYLVRGRQGAYETAELPWSRELLRDLEEVRRPDRDPATVARVGALLREFLDPAGWGAHESTIVQARTDRRRVHLTIRSAAAELYALPWELLTLRADGQHLGALDHLLLRYAWPGTSTISADDAQTDARRILMAWSAAGGGVPAAEQTKAIEAAVQIAGGTVELLTNAAYGHIADALEAASKDGRPFTALHLLCHGAEAGSTFGLSLDAEDGGRPVVVDAGRLQQLLSPHAHTLRLVVVAACDGGNMGEPGNRIGSVAQRLHRAGIHYVVASRYPLSAKGSTRMTGALYESLLGGQPVERAFIAARSAASREVSQLDWASLQLYARPEDGDRGCVLAPAPMPAYAVPVNPGPVAAPAIAAPPVEAIAPIAPPASGGSSPALMGLMGLALIAGLAFAGYRFLGASDSVPTDATPEPPVAATPKEPVPVPAQTPAVPANGSTGAGDPSDSGHSGSSGGADPVAATTDPTSGVADSPTEPSTRPKSPRPRPNRVSKTRPANRCGKIKERLSDGIGAPSGGGSYPVEIWVFEDGSTKLASCTDCGDRGKAAKSKLSRMQSTLTKASLQSELPCRAKFDWQ